MSAALQGFLLTMDRAEARAELERIVSGDPSYAEAHYNLGLLCEADGEIPRARTHFARASELTKVGRTYELARAALQRTASPKGSADRTARYEGAVRQAAAFQGAGLSALAASRAADAIELDAARWEAYAIAAEAFKSLQRYDEASRMVERARGGAPSEASSVLLALSTQISQDAECQPTVAKAVSAYRSKAFEQAGDLFVEALKRPCGTRDEFRLAAASAYARSGAAAKGRRVLGPLLSSADPETREKARSLERTLSR